MSEIPADLGGLTFEELKDLQDALGRPIGEVFQAIQGMAEGDLSGLDADMLVGFTWLRLRADDPDLKIEAVWKMDLSALGALAGADPLVSTVSPAPIQSTG